MKKVLTGILSFLFVFTINTQAQNPNRPNSIIISRVITDYYGMAGDGDILEFDNYRGGFEAAYLKNLNEKLNFKVPLRVGVFNLPSELNNQTFIGLDGLIQLQLFKDSAAVIPYAFAGAGLQIEEFDDSNFQVPFGIGFYFKLGKYAYVNLEGQYRKSFEVDRDHMQFGGGLGFMIGKIIDQQPVLPPVEVTPPDRDGDGITDVEDQCPDIAGLAAHSGCPDTDNDGIRDSEDECPDAVGSLQTRGCPDRDNDGFADPNDPCPDTPGMYKGCPDSDGDGIPNDKDKCPGKAGPQSNNGCPLADTDGDGVVDILDKCPTRFGSESSNGCPDTDNDGLDDSRDKCPNSSGPVHNEGCPEITQQDQAILEYAIQAVQFETGRSTLKPESYSVLRQISDIMGRYPDYKLVISGHTDNVGDETINKELSFARARACYEQLRQNGVRTERLTYAGYGETKPVADNTTKEGRRLNRRVEFELIPNR